MFQQRRFLFLGGLSLLFLGFVAAVWTGYSTLHRAEAAYMNGEYQAAFDLYVRAMRFLPWRNDLNEKAGIAAGAGGDFPNAITYLERASNLSEQGWVTLGFSYFNTGDFESALKAYQNGLKEYDSLAIYAGMRLIHFQKKDWAGEQQVLENMVRLRDSDAFSHYRLGLLLMLLEPESAEGELLLASSLDPQYAPAVQTLTSALKASALQTDESARTVTLGRALGLVQEWDLALSAFESAAQADKKNAEAWAWLGEAKQQTGQDGSADLDTALSLDKESVIVRALRGLYWSRQGNYRKMLDEYAAAAVLEPENPAWQAAIGDANLKLGDLAAALEAYQLAVELAPDDPTYWRLLAVLCASNGVRIEDIGLPAAQKAVELAPADPLALDALGYVYFSSGRYASAQETLMQAIELDPKNFSAHIHLAMNYLAQGNQAAAFSELTLVRDADTNGPHGELARQLLVQYFP